VGSYISLLPRMLNSEGRPSAKLRVPNIDPYHFEYMCVCGRGSDYHLNTKFSEWVMC
jgi:hypothetical protein